MSIAIDGSIFKDSYQVEPVNYFRKKFHHKKYHF